MISPAEALKVIEQAVRKLPQEKRVIFESSGYVVAETVFSPIHMPSFRQSAMDGYAFNFVEGQMRYEIVGEVAAGSSVNPDLKPGEGVRIFTGAMVPDTATIVVQQEIIERVDNSAVILQEVAVGKNIRPIGEQIREGDLALEKGTVLSPAAIGFLTGLGITEVMVYRKPKVTIVTTGNELVKPGTQLEPGQIYESNSAMLSAALSAYQYGGYEVYTVVDDYHSTKKQIESAIQQSDLVILTGGISVGDYDYVGKALQEIGVEQLFYRIKQKPGKPIYMGKHQDKLIAALPGNPAAALSCFYIYVLPTLNQMCGKPFTGLEKVKLPIAEAYQKKGERAEFLKAKIMDNKVVVLGKQSSAMLRSFAIADGLMFLPADRFTVGKGDEVIVYKFPQNE